MNAFQRQDVALIVVLILALELISTDAFSTISSSRIPAPALLNGRPSSSSARGAGGSYASVVGVENGHTNNYVTAIEDCVSFEDGGRGLFVATTDHNYAIQSPALEHEQGWQSVTVNGDQVFVLTSWNRTFSTSLSALNERQRDFIAEARANFTQNLAGLRLAHYTSGSSTSLPSGNTLGTSGSGYSAARPSVAELAIAQMVGPPNSASGQQWSQFVSSSADTPRPQEYQHTQGSGAASAPPAPPSFQASQAQTFLEANALPPSAASFFFSKRRSFGTNETSKVDLPTTTKKPEVVLTSTTTSKKPETVASSKKTRRTLPRYAQAPPTQQFIYAPNYNEQMSSPGGGGGVGDPLASKSLCSPARWLDSFNYYNLNAGSPLNKSLAGDIYFFDFHCNTLDVYSSSASMRQSLGMSAIYRDANFFSFSRSNLPSAINRIFLVDKHVFLIYNDGSLLVKANWMLESYELDLIVQARNKLKLIGAWQSRAANLVAS